MLLLEIGDIDRRIAAGESLARDRFDSDCVLGTQLESSPLGLTEISRFLPNSPERAGLFSEILSLQRRF